MTPPLTIGRDTLPDVEVTDSSNFPAPIMLMGRIISSQSMPSEAITHIGGLRLQVCVSSINPTQEHMLRRILPFPSTSPLRHLSASSLPLFHLATA